MNYKQENTVFIHAFDELLEAYVAKSDEENQGTITYYESGFFSPCYQKLDQIGASEALSEVDFEQGEKIAWKPYLRKENATLENLEAALDITIPLELQVLFCRYYANDINASTDYGNLTILQALNETDFDRLQKNLIAHVLMKRRLKQKDTLFFALTDEEDFILSIDLSTQAVMLEEVGKEPNKLIANDLASFFATLVPQPQLVSL